MLAIYGIHVLALVVSVRTTLCLQQDGNSFLCAWLYGLSVSSGQLSAIVVWSLLTWSFWLEPILAPRSQTAAAG